MLAIGFKESCCLEKLLLIKSRCLRDHCQRRKLSWYILSVPICTFIHDFQSSWGSELDTAVYNLMHYERPLHNKRHGSASSLFMQKASQIWIAVCGNMYVLSSLEPVFGIRSGVYLPIPACESGLLSCLHAYAALALNCMHCHGLPPINLLKPPLLSIFPCQA